MLKLGLHIGLLGLGTDGSKSVLCPNCVLAPWNWDTTVFLHNWTRTHWKASLLPIADDNFRSPKAIIGMGGIIDDKGRLDESPGWMKETIAP